MEKFFKDIKDQWMREPKDGGISEDDSKNPAAVQTWLDDYLTTRIKKKGAHGPVACCSEACTGDWHPRCNTRS